MEHNDVVKFMKKLQAIIDALDQFESNCIICEEKTYQHVAVLSDGSVDGSDLGFGKPPVGFRYGIVPLCNKHDLNDAETSRQVRIAIEIKKLTKEFRYIGDTNKIITDEDIEDGEVA